ncbi:MAG: PAS domain-containing protein [Chloroflexi bacterium]|nr:PAS domain-containing protein [Chloroflexota bacterium]
MTATEPDEGLRLIVDNSPDVTFCQDRDLRYLWIKNPAPPHSADQLVGKTDRDIFGEQQALKLADLKRHVLETGAEIRYELPLTVAGKEYWYDSVFKPRRDQSGHVVGILGWARDVTIHKREEEERERLLAELGATIASVADGLVIYDSTGNIVRVNPAAERMLGYSLTQLQLPLSERIALVGAETAAGKPFSIDELPVQRAMRGETVHGVVTVLHPPDGGTIWTSVSAAPIRSSDGRVLGSVAGFTDITALHELQEQREDFIRSISHDLRTPLASILGQAQVIKRFADRTDLVRDGADAILAGGRRIEAMLQDLVTSVRLEAGQMPLELRPIALGDLVAEMLARSSGAMEIGRVGVEVPADLPRVLADPDRLERVLINLLTNALKYSPRETEVLFKAEARENEVRVSVSDSGTGISPDDLPRIFDRFYRAKGHRETEGLGLGLFIARMLIEAHGGRIWVESELGKGSTFYVSLATCE